MLVKYRKALAPEHRLIDGISVWQGYRHRFAALVQKLQHHQLQSHWGLLLLGEHQEVLAVKVLDGQGRSLRRQQALAHKCPAPDTVHQLHVQIVIELHAGLRTQHHVQIAALYPALELSERIAFKIQFRHGIPPQGFLPEFHQLAAKVPAHADAHPQS